MAKANPFRFSTKYQDDESDLLYYGYRYYSASLGRWPSRDPAQERGGRNQYAFVTNDPQGRCDRLGKQGIGIIGPGDGPIDLPPGTPPWYPPPPPPPPPPPRTCCCKGKVIDGTPVVVFKYCTGRSPSGDWDHAWIEMDGSSAGFYPKSDTDAGSHPGGYPINVPGEVDIPESDHYLNHSGKACQEIKYSPCDVNIVALRAFLWNGIWTDHFRTPDYNVLLNNCYDWAAKRIILAHLFANGPKHGCSNDPHEFE